MTGQFNEVMKSLISLWWEFGRTAEKMGILLPTIHLVDCSVWLVRLDFILWQKEKGTWVTSIPEEYHLLTRPLIADTYIFTYKDMNFLNYESTYRCLKWQNKFGNKNKLFLFLSHPLRFTFINIMLLFSLWRCYISRDRHYEWRPKMDSESLN